MSPLWVAMRWFGAWPQTVTPDGRFVRSLWSARTIVPALLFVFTSWRFLIAFGQRLEFVAGLPPEDFAHKVASYQFLIYAMAQLMIVLLSFETPKIEQFAGMWAEFQPKIELACSVSMRNPALRRTVFITVLALVIGWPLAVAVPLSVTGYRLGMSVPETLFYAYVTTVLNFTSTQWRMLCELLRMNAVQLRNGFEEALRSPKLDKERVATFQSLWQDLTALQNMAGFAVGSSTLLNMTIYSLTFTQCAYHTLYSVLRGFNFFGFFLLAVGSLTGFTTSRIFNAAHIVNEELGTKFKLTLNAASFSNLSRETVQQLDAFTSIMVAHPPNFRIFGFLPINRSSLAALWATVATYLVVLIQFSL